MHLSYYTYPNQHDAIIIAIFLFFSGVKHQETRWQYIATLRFIIMSVPQLDLCCFGPFKSNHI